MKKTIAPKLTHAPEPTSTEPASQSFFSYLLLDSANRKLLILSLVINGLLFFGYKYFFPLPDFFSDSNGYVLAAQSNLKVFYRPWGYSYYLKMIRTLSSGVTVVVVMSAPWRCVD